jgi:hypothetical protein
MYANIITAQKIASGETMSASIISPIALSMGDIKDRLLSMGWIALSVYNEKLPDRTI